ncbi:class II aldolase/adducin family protein [Thalassotalea euphylliae]|uniref:Class II aldolase/adducin family protein n=1 Tax=Thalassotalea euphylliae TaxID=1655234 RepID=A0A3E0TLX2_9GAMM|nr:class II aldolase/adducin family protein [Thalassotalea euphylliae]REL25541.1 class II aldolase/adducin family protein [Thalassotalea euphylliae]
MTALAKPTQATVKNLTRGSEQFEVPKPPVFDDVMAQRQYDKQRLASAFRVFAMKGFDEGLAGHITVRDAVEPDSFWVNPLAVHFSQIKASDLVRVDHQGNIVEGHHPINNAAFAIHSRIHEARPDVNAVAHAHTTYGRAFASLGIKLEPISQDACMFYNNHGLFSEFTGVVAVAEEGDLIAKALGQGSGVILQNHGLLTVGKSVDAAAANFVIMDSCCHSQLLAQAAGELALIPEEVAIQTQKINGSDYVTWGNYQPMYAQVLAQDNSFLA